MGESVWIPSRECGEVNLFLWILQILLGLFFLLTGVIHFVLPPGLPAAMSWMYDLAPALHYFSGTAEILGGLGLILPSAFRIKPKLTPLAAAGLALVMVGAAVWHFPRGEMLNTGMNVVVIVLTGFVAYGRWRLNPIEARSGAGGDQRAV